MAQDNLLNGTLENTVLVRLRLTNPVHDERQEVFQWDARSLAYDIPPQERAYPHVL